MQRAPDRAKKAFCIRKDLSTLPVTLMVSRPFLALLQVSFIASTGDMNTMSKPVVSWTPAYYGDYYNIRHLVNLVTNFRSVNLQLKSRLSNPHQVRVMCSQGVEPEDSFCSRRPCPALNKGLSQWILFTSLLPTANFTQSSIGADLVWHIRQISPTYEHG